VVLPIRDFSRRCEAAWVEGATALPAVDVGWRQAACISPEMVLASLAPGELEHYFLLYSNCATAFERLFPSFRCHPGHSWYPHIPLGCSPCSSASSPQSEKSRLKLVQVMQAPASSKGLSPATLLSPQFAVEVSIAAVANNWAVQHLTSLVEIRRPGAAAPGDTATLGLNFSRRYHSRAGQAVRICKGCPRTSAGGEPNFAMCSPDASLGTNRIFGAGAQAAVLCVFPLSWDERVGLAQVLARTDCDRVRAEPLRRVAWRDVPGAGGAVVALLTAAVAGVHVARKNEAWLRRSGSQLHGAARLLLSSEDPSGGEDSTGGRDDASAAPQRSSSDLSGGEDLS